MEERKHIDRIFQEKFKDFEATPRDVVWDNISSQLKKNNTKRRILPLWYKIAGTAAILTLFLNYASDLFKNTVTNTSTASSLVKDDLLNITLASPEYTQNMLRSSLVLNAIMSNTKYLEANTAIENKALDRTRSNSIKSLKVVSRGNTDKYTLEDLTSPDMEVASPHDINGSDISMNNKKDLPLSRVERKDGILADQIVSPKKLRVSTMAAPIYYDNFGSGTSIDSQFEDNESGGEISVSYGINLAYQISEKIKIRSGISKVDLSYNTKNIAFTAAVNPTSLSSVNYTEGNAPNFRIENRTVEQFSNLSASAEFNRASIAAPTAGYLNQKLGFIEVPLEIEYVIIDKKIGVNIIGGGSTLFLNNNMISLNSTDFSTNLGEANNLNNISFSTNLGVGIDYNISPQFELNFEPIFKYQLNTFSRTSGNVNPYYFGVYSGFSFKF